MKLQIVEFATFWKIPRLQGVNLENLLRLVSTPDFYAREWVPYGYFEYKSHYRLAKIPEDQLCRGLERSGVYEYEIIKSENFPFKIVEGYTMVNKPKDDLQDNVIKKVLKVFDKSERCIVSLQTGQGKTYVATNIISHLKCKAIIMVKSNELKKQWVQSFSTHTDLKYKDIYSIDTGDDWYAIKENTAINPQIVITTHKALNMFIDKIGNAEFTKFIINNQYGIKVFDEFDLENKSMFLLDTLTSLRYTLYLSATTYKSSKQDDRVFQRIFRDVDDIGKEFRVTVPRNGLFVIYSSNPSEKTYNTLMKWTPAGLALDYQKYHAYVVLSRTYRDALKDLWDKLISKRFYSEETLKTVFFVGRKGEISEQFKKDIVELFGVKDEDVSILNSDTPKKDRDRIMRSAKLIVSTSKSMGRGIDLKGLDIIVDLETRASESETTQVIGRVSRTGMKNVGTYISLVDYSIGTVKDNYLRKLQGGFYKEHLTKIKEISIGNIKNDPVKLTEGTRLIVSGSRTFDNYELLKKTIDEYVKDHGPISEIVSGKAKGADTLGERYAKERNIKIVEFPAEWNKYGKKAGYMRNVEMGKYCTEAIMFNQGSKGTEIMISVMKHFKKPYKEIKC